MFSEPRKIPKGIYALPDLSAFFSAGPYLHAPSLYHREFVLQINSFTLGDCIQEFADGFAKQLAYLGQQYRQVALYPGGTAFSLRHLFATNDYGFPSYRLRSTWEIVPVLEEEIDIVGTDLRFHAANR